MFPINGLDWVIMLVQLLLSEKSYQGIELIDMRGRLMYHALLVCSMCVCLICHLITYIALIARRTVEPQAEEKIGLAILQLMLNGQDTARIDIHIVL